MSNFPLIEDLTPEILEEYAGYSVNLTEPYRGDAPREQKPPVETMETETQNLGIFRSGELEFSVKYLLASRWVWNSTQTSWGQHHVTVVQATSNKHIRQILYPSKVQGLDAYRAIRDWVVTGAKFYTAVQQHSS